MSHKNLQAFTVVELLIVVFIIGILATLTVVGYRQVRSSASDASILSDLDTMETAQTAYGLANGLAGKAYYSGTGTDADLKFTASAGNVIDVVINGTDYCIRGYNPNGTKKSIDTAFTKESSPGACTTLVASTQARADSPAVIVWSSSVTPADGCAVAVGGVVYCWGYNHKGQLGNGNNTNSAVPVAVKSSGGPMQGGNIVQIDGEYTKTALDSNGIVYSWGESGYYGSLGNGTSGNGTSSNVPVAVTTAGTPMAGKTITRISSAAVHTLALSSDGQVFAWGNNTTQPGVMGIVGAGSNVPVAVTTAGTPMAGKTIIDIAASDTFSLALASDNTLFVWGGNRFGQYGNNTYNNSYSNYLPVVVPVSGTPMAGKTIIQLSVAPQSAFALASDGSIYGWGEDGSLGMLGSGTSGRVSCASGFGELCKLRPTLVTTTSTPMAGKIIVKIAAGRCSFALSSEGTLYSWGVGTYGCMGTSNTSSSAVPVAVTTTGTPMAGKSISQVVAGGSRGISISSDGQAFSWGSNLNSGLGDGTSANRSSPVSIISTTN